MVLEEFTMLWNKQLSFASKTFHYPTERHITH